MVSILSINLQNYLGNDKIPPSQLKSLLSNHVKDAVIQNNIQVICTQEDNEGLQIDGFNQVVLACDKSDETVRIYVKKWFGHDEPQETHF